MLADIENAKQWNRSWDSIEITSTQRHGVGTTFRAHLEGDMAFDFEIVDWSNNERIAIAPIRDDGERYAMQLEEQIFTLREAPDDMTEIELKAVASVHGVRGRIYGLFFWSGHQQAGLNEALDAIEDTVDPIEDDDEDDEDEVEEVPE